VAIRIFKPDAAVAAPLIARFLARTDKRAATPTPTLAPVAEEAKAPAKKVARRRRAVSPFEAQFKKAIKLDASIGRLPYRKAEADTDYVSCAAGPSTDAAPATPLRRSPRKSGPPDPATEPDEAASPIVRRSPRTSAAGAAPGLSPPLRRSPRNSLSTAAASPARRSGGDGPEAVPAAEVRGERRTAGDVASSGSAAGSGGPDLRGERRSGVAGAASVDGPAAHET
jgi:hypothetical protein